MPLHQYFCPAGHVFEVLEGINEDAPKRCPKCKRMSEHRYRFDWRTDSEGRQRRIL